MSRDFDKIKGIDGSKETVKLAVRITDLWFVQNYDYKNSHLEMVLMGGQGDKIQAIARKEEMETWQSKLKENATYAMYNFRVLSNDSQYKVCNHPFKLQFIGGTTFSEHNFPHIPMNSYQFKAFNDILSGNYLPDMLVDVIGLFDDATFQPGKETPGRVIFDLKDFGGEVIACTLWGDYASKFLTYREQNSSSRCMVIMLTQARTKPAQGVYRMTLSNSLYGSKLLINDEVPDYAIYKERLMQNILSDKPSASHGLSQTSGSSQFSDVDRFTYKTRVLSVSHITKLPDGTNFSTIGTTTKLITGKNGWFYLGCNKCNKKNEREDVSYTCACGTFHERPIPRYKVEISVSFGKESTNFVFWERECAGIIGMSALELRNLMVQSQEGTPKHYPKHLDKMLGLKLALRCKFQKKFNNSTVSKISDDSDLIRAILELIGADEGTSTVADRSVDKVDIGLNDLQPDNESLSVTADHDPEVNTSITPAKRLSSEMQGDELLSQESVSAQLSTTKLIKTIKTE